MPMQVESLTPDSTEQSIKDAISASMSQCMKEGGKEMKECAGMIYDMARTATGKELRFGKQ